jgi:hydrogenase maturation protease
VSDAVIGVGNRLRRDDGVGLVVAERLQGEAPAALALEHVPPDLYERWGEARRVFLVDAASSGAEPGTVRRLDVSREPAAAEALRFSTHGFGVLEAVELARALGRLPRQVVVFAIEGEDFGNGEGLSARVAAAAEQVVGRIREELSQEAARA